MGQLTRGELKALALHEWIAERLREEPSLLSLVRSRLRWLRERNPAGLAYYAEWERLVEGPLPDLLDVMVGRSEHACALRQESPFADLVDQRERARIHRTVTETLDGDSRS